jgi:hypothetical protein
MAWENSSAKNSLHLGKIMQALAKVLHELGK